MSSSPTGRPRAHLTARALALSERLARAAGRDTPAFVGLAHAEVCDELPLGTIAGPYRVEHVIGRGGMSVVYQARDPWGSVVALKVARTDDPRDPQCRERLLLEALVLDGLRHPSIAALRDVGELPDGRPWLALERVDGEPLHLRLARGPVSIEEACAIVVQIASALGVAHAVGVVHRDLKPDNVLLAGDAGRPRCTLIDWGVARSRAVPHERITEIGVVSGTPLYMSPEQARGHEVDGRSDVYALGVMTYEMLCGAPPFDADDSVAILLKHVGSPAPRASTTRPDLPGWLDHLIAWMLAKQPDARPALEDVHRILVSRGVRAASPAPIGEALDELDPEADTIVQPAQVGLNAA